MRKWMVLVFCLVCECSLPVKSSVTREGDGHIELFQTSDTYDVESTVMLNDVSRADKEVAYKIRASLLVEPVWKNSLDTEFLLKFELENPHLLSRGKRVNEDFLRHSSIWDSYPHSIFYAHWKNGLIQTSYLDLNELTDIVNYKRSLISLFQFQLLDGETTETDISGTCNVLYETLSADTVRKIKSGCEEWGGLGRSRRVARYSLGAAGLRALHAEEVHEAAGLKARAWSRLSRVASAPAAPATTTPAPSAPPAPLAAAPLHEPLADLPRWPDDELLDAEGAFALGAELWTAEEPGAGGTAGAARAALRVLPALCAAPTPRLAALLHAQLDPAPLRALVSALGSCGSARAHSAVGALLQLTARGAHASDPPALPGLAADYLAALAVAPAPEESVIEDVLKLGAWPSGADDADALQLAESALLAGAAAARRRPARAPAARALLLAALQACPDDLCRAAHVRALGNLASADTADVLLSWAENGSASVAGAALTALDALPAPALRLPGPLHRLRHVVLSGRPLAVRAAALDLLVRLSAPAPFGLARVAYELRAGPPELRRVLWQRLDALAAHEDVALLLRALPAALRWHGATSPGTSSVLRRVAGGARLAGGPEWRADLDSVQLASGGVLRRGVVRLVTVAPDNSTDDTLTVELRANGLEAFAGSGGEGEGEGEEQAVSAALEFSVGGARLPPVTLFDGHGELLRLVWAGAGSEPTRAVRAVRRLPRAAAALRLLDGAPLRARRDVAAALALDAHAQVSLWSRNARAALELRAGVAVQGAAEVRAAWGRLSAARESLLAPRLRIAADLDFYDGVALCVRPRVEPAPQLDRVALNSTLGRDARGVRRVRTERREPPARTLSLGALNDEACRALGSDD